MNFLGQIYALNILSFAKNSVFAIFYGLLVTHLVAHRFTLGNPKIAITIMHLLAECRHEYECLLCKN